MADAKITDIRLMRLDPYKSIGYWNLFRIDTDQGVWGLGESYWGPGLRDVVEELLKPYLVGENPLDVDRLFTRMYSRAAGIHSMNGLVMSAMSGIEIALWDLAGKLTGLPVYRLLGGKFRDRVRLYRTGTPNHADQLSACQEYAARLREQGWTAIKTIDVDTLWERYDPQFHQPGHEPMARTLTLSDLRMAEKIMGNMRQAFGEDYDIAVHCHWALDLRDAQQLAERMAPYHPLWLEDPLPVSFSPAWVHLTRTSPVPICTGENLYGRHEFRPFIEEHGTDFVHIDVPKSGGLLETKRIADLADTHYLKTCMHYAASVVGMVASAHAAVSIRGFGLLERAGEDFAWWEDLVLHDRPIIKDGYLQLPEGPGFGLALNPEVVRQQLAAGEQYWGP